MTIIFFEEEVILVKTFKTGSSSLHFYLMGKLLDDKEFINYLKKDEAMIETKKYLITDYMTGHERFEELRKLTDRDLSDFIIIGIVREPIGYVKSCFNQFLHDKVKQAKGVKLLRFISIYSRTLAYMFFYFYYIVLWKEKAGVVNANYKILETYNIDNVIVFDYDNLETLNKVLPKFDSEIFSMYDIRKYSNKKVPSFFNRGIRKRFNLDRKLLDGLLK